MINKVWIRILLKLVAWGCRRLKWAHLRERVRKFKRELEREMERGG